MANWKDIVAAVAPAIGTALGGPVAGLAIAELSRSLLGRTNGTEAEVAAAVQAGGADAIVRLRAADQAFAIRLRELDIDIEKLHQADRANAREREAKTGDSLTPQALAYLVTAGFFGVLFWLLIEGKPAAGGDALLVMLGALGGAWASVISYYFGSSAGSKDKSELLARKETP
jgi:hypothetical protein